MVPKTGISVINPGWAISSSKIKIENIIKASPITDNNSLNNLGKQIFFFKIIVHKIPATNSQALVGSKKKEPALPLLDSIWAKIKLSTKTISNKGVINCLKYLKLIKIKIGNKM